MTQLVKPEELDKIVDTLKAGEVVAFATDTVFGVGVVYDNYDAVCKMKVAKGRDEGKPFPLMVSDLEQMKQVAYLSSREEKIVEALTPGALTLVLNKKDTLEDKFTNGKKTVAIRIPDDSFVLKLLSTVGPMFVTSANISGQPSANNDKEVLAQLDGRIAMVVEGEAYSHVASTIIDCTGEEIKILRQGDITLNDIEKAISR